MRTLAAHYAVDEHRQHFQRLPQMPFRFTWIELEKSRFYGTISSEVITHGQFLSLVGIRADLMITSFPTLSYFRTSFLYGSKNRLGDRDEQSTIPAKIAGVKRIVIVSPPNSDGKIDPLTIVAADLCGANEIYRVGGAQAIAALSFGTKSISKVDKIVGPGGMFVTLAKFMVSERTSIDMLAGPTELGIIADATANPRYIALDLISQSEHSNDTFCYLITNSEKLAKSVDKIITELSNKIKRNNFVKTSLKENGFIAICKFYHI